MYRIEEVNSTFVANVNFVNYVRRDDLTKTWISTDPATAQAISVKGEIYNIAGYPVIEGYPIVKVFEIVPKEEFKWQSKDPFFVQKA